MDWGTSNFRAFRFDNTGKVIGRRSYPIGILKVREGRFSETLQEHVGDWIADGETHVLLCGMVGSRQGWTEANYIQCPVKIDDLAKAVVKISFAGAKAMLIPGVMGEDSNGVPEVMRGEETEAMGIVDDCDGCGLVCLPGTHTKWIELRDRSIVSFLTCMTGDAFAALRKHTILAKLMNSEAIMDEASFLRGVARSADAGGLLHHLFSVRTLALTGDLKEDTTASYLSGLLIGHEVRAVMPSEAHVHLVGALQLCKLYQQAIAALGGTSTVEDEDAAARGLAAIGRRLNWR
ncbi:MAG TPA: 2-dehydro-3-deoxygalactonokinase [Edaphobacter sp.]|nr:2-dehydro-3-deoxygalactonokinase [Edaphobacter sp.]